VKLDFTPNHICAGFFLCSFLLPFSPCVETSLLTAVPFHLKMVSVKADKRLTWFSEGNHVETQI
jgi:hypothetical protein